VEEPEVDAVWVQMRTAVFAVVLGRAARRLVVFVMERAGAGIGGIAVEDGADGVVAVVVGMVSTGAGEVGRCVRGDGWVAASMVVGLIRMGRTSVARIA